MKLPFASVALALVFALFGGCARPFDRSSTKPADVAYYTCTMHPSVRSQDPDGKCPICGMDLVPVMKTEAKAPTASAGEEPPHEFTVPLDRQQLIGVTYATARVRLLRRVIRAMGTVAAMTTKHWDYVARVDGYVRTLHVNAPGEHVVKGETLLDLYSPDLVSTEGEYLDLLKMREAGRRDHNQSAVENAERLLAAAQNRLEQWNIPQEEIARIAQDGKPEEFLALSSPVTGLVEEVMVHQGSHVAVGDHLVDLVDLSAVWVWADVYENELPDLKAGVPVEIASEAMPDFHASGLIASVDPFIDPAKRTARVRIDLQNPDFKLLPHAYVEVLITLDEGDALTVPASAVLPTGRRNLVFVDKGAGRLEPRFIEIEGPFGDEDRVTAGLKAGDRVVNSANFLIDAESRVQGALKDF